MRIVHISTAQRSGGAARAAYRLHVGLQRLGLESRMLVQWGDGKDPTVQEFCPDMSMSARLRHRIRRWWVERDFGVYKSSRPSGLELFSDDRSIYGAELVSKLPPCDVVTLHWVSGFIDYAKFFSGLNPSIPVVWYLHDMNPFTGGCHYTAECTRYLHGCGSCPQLGSSASGDLSAQIWERKSHVFKNLPAERLQLVAPSQWLAEKIKESRLLQKLDVQVIPYGLDTSEFKPTDIHCARELTNIPADAPVICVLAADLSVRRKGIDLLMQALNKMSGFGEIIVLSVGRGRFEVPSNVRLIHKDVINDDRWLSLLYSAADVCVIPSREDNLPNVALESIACGTPVVAFEVGGLPDMVRPGLTGFLAKPFDVDALARSLTSFFSDREQKQQMRAHCRRIAVEEYSLEVQACRYKALCESLIEEQ